MKAQLLFLCAALACAGCSESGSGQSAQTSKKSAPSAPKPAPQADSLAAMASAVAVSKSNAEIELKYDIANKPVLGQPVEVKLMFVPMADAQSLTVDVSALQPLQLSGQSKASFQNVKLGETNPQSFTLLAPPEAGEGIYVANVAVSLQRGSAISSKTFAIPVIFAKTEATPAAGAPVAAAKTGKG